VHWSIFGHNGGSGMKQEKMHKEELILHSLLNQAMWGPLLVIRTGAKRSALKIYGW
jgi:hypothetical protein